MFVLEGCHVDIVYWKDVCLREMYILERDVWIREIDVVSAIDMFEINKFVFAVVVAFLSKSSIKRPIT